jgi:uncharacterized membrane protein YphA (DoxX/SURF4 family)
VTAAGFGYVSGLALAVVLLVAAAAKLRDPAGTASSFRALGLPAPGTLARAVPAVEATVALALVGWPPVGAFAALVVLVFFTTFLVSRLLAGEQAPCSCFGSARQEPIAAANLVGNGFLLLLALAAMAAPAPRWPQPADGVVLAVAVGIEVAVHAAVRRWAPPERRGAGGPATR